MPPRGRGACAKMGSCSFRGMSLRPNHGARLTCAPSSALHRRSLYQAALPGVRSETHSLSPLPGGAGGGFLPSLEG